jgi:hypothetical protein
MTRVLLLVSPDVSPINAARYERLAEALRAHCAVDVVPDRIPAGGEPPGDGLVLVDRFGAVVNAAGSWSEEHAFQQLTDAYPVAARQRMVLLSMLPGPTTVRLAAAADLAGFVDHTSLDTATGGTSSPFPPGSHGPLARLRRIGVSLEYELDPWGKSFLQPFDDFAALLAAYVRNGDRDGAGDGKS